MERVFVIIAVLFVTSFVANAQTVQTPLAEPHWIAQRVAAAEAALAQSEAGQLVWRSIEAHGGLTHWFESGAIQFRFDYRPLQGRPPVDTHQVIDVWSSRAVHWSPVDEGVRFGWDGTSAWTLGDRAQMPRSPRFWTTTPYYFVGVPWVLADPGVNLSMEGSQEWRGRTFDTVRVTFDPGTGDAPDDYYIVYIDRENQTVGGVRYVVSYPGFFPDGGHTPEKFVSYEGLSAQDGLVVAASYQFYSWVDGAVGVLVTDGQMTDFRVRRDASDADFAQPEGATVVEGY